MLQELQPFIGSRISSIKIMKKITNKGCFLSYGKDDPDIAICHSFFMLVLYKISGLVTSSIQICLVHTKVQPKFLVSAEAKKLLLII